MNSAKKEHAIYSGKAKESRRIKERKEEEANLVLVYYRLSWAELPNLEYGVSGSPITLKDYEST